MVAPPVKSRLGVSVRSCVLQARYEVVPVETHGQAEDDGDYCHQGDQDPRDDTRLQTDGAGGAQLR